MKTSGRKQNDRPKWKQRASKHGKLKGEQNQIHIAVGKHKWKALRELKKARIEAGVYQAVRDDSKDTKKKTDLMSKGKAQSEKVKEEKMAETERQTEEERQRELEGKRRQRQRYTKKLTSKTKHGQPVMKHQISYLLHKIKSDS